MRNTIILFIVALALGAYVYFYEIKGGEERDKEKAEAEKVLLFNKDSVNYLSIEGMGQQFEFSKEGEHWEIIKPVQTLADNAPLSTLLNSIAEAKKERTFSVNPAELEQYGISERALKIDLKSHDHNIYQLRLGDKSSIGANVYASVADTAVYLTSEQIKKNALKSLFDWRDKKTVHFDKNALRKLTLKNPKGKITLKKEGSQWQIITPLKAAADQEAIKNILNMLQNQNIQSVVSEGTNRLKKYGLDHPAYRLEMFSGKELAKNELLFAENSANEYFGNDAGRPHIFTVDSSYMKTLKQSLFELRDKSIVEFDQSSIDQINLSKNSHLTTLNKDTTGNWFAADSLSAKQWKVSSILSTLNRLEAAAFVEENARYINQYELLNPLARIELYAGDNPVAKIHFGSVKKNRVYVRNTVNKQVVLIEQSDFDTLFPDHDELFEKSDTETMGTEQ